MPVTKVVACARGAANLWDPVCGPRIDCPTPRGADPAAGSVVYALGLFTVQGNQFVLTSVWCVTGPGAAPQPSPAAVRDQVIRLLPRVAIGTTWHQRALVNAQDILWADTPARRTLPPARVVGRTVTLRISLRRADWDFGDGTHATTTDPGTAYDPTTDPCTTARCPDYFGHTYHHTGTTTIRLTITWNADFSLDNGTTWTPVDPTGITGPTTTDTLTIDQAQGVLVPTP